MNSNPMLTNSIDVISVGGSGGSNVDASIKPDTWIETAKPKLKLFGSVNSSFKVSQVLFVCLAKGANS
jgi:hypothetical protein